MIDFATRSRCVVAPRPGRRRRTGLMAADELAPPGGADLELALGNRFSSRDRCARTSAQRAVKVYAAEGDRRGPPGSRPASQSSRCSRVGRRSYRPGNPACRRGAPRGRARGVSLTVTSRSSAQPSPRAAPVASTMHSQLAEQAVAIGTSSTEPDLHAIALVSLGMLKPGAGATGEGLASIEEASVAAVNGELSPLRSGDDLLPDDLGLSRPQRLPAGQRVDRGHRALLPAQVGGRVPGRLPRPSGRGRGGRRAPGTQAEIGSRPGDRRSSSAYRAIAAAGRRLLRASARSGACEGDLEGAEAALREAHARGHSPQPALALIRLAEGKVKAAAKAIEAAVEETGDRWARAQAAAGAGRDPDRGRRRRDGARAASRSWPRSSPATHRRRSTRRAKSPDAGRVLLAEGEPAGATASSGPRSASWREVGAPYEVARDRAPSWRWHCSDLDDEDAAFLELAAARATSSGAWAHAGCRGGRAAADRGRGPSARARAGPQDIHVHRHRGLHDAR